MFLLILHDVVTVVHCYIVFDNQCPEYLQILKVEAVAGGNGGALFNLSLSSKDRSLASLFPGFPNGLNGYTPWSYIQYNINCLSSGYTHKLQAHKVYFGDVWLLEMMLLEGAFV